MASNFCFVASSSCLKNVPLSTFAKLQKRTCIAEIKKKTKKKNSKATTTFIPFHIDFDYRVRLSINKDLFHTVPFTILCCDCKLIYTIVYNL